MGNLDFFWSIMGVILVLSLVLYLLPPFLFRYCTFIQRELLFMNRLKRLPPADDLSEPSKFGLEGVESLSLRNTLDRQNRVQLGVWYIPSRSQLECQAKTSTSAATKFTTTTSSKKRLQHSRPTVLYVHGNAGNRGGEYRIRLYKELSQNFDCNIVTFDYRGYGDSTYLKPSSEGIISDTRFMYDWLINDRKCSPKDTIVWAHSLGTAVAVQSIASLPVYLQPHKLVLEAPFDSLANAVAMHPFTRFHSTFPRLLDYCLAEPIRQSTEFQFDTASYICDISKKTDIFIMHSQDDPIIPEKLGRSLYNKAKQEISAKSVQFVSLDASLKLGHNNIPTHEETMQKVKVFLGS